MHIYIQDFIGSLRVAQKALPKSIVFRPRKPCHAIHAITELPYSNPLQNAGEWREVYGEVEVEVDAELEENAGGKGG